MLDPMNDPKWMAQHSDYTESSLETALDDERCRRRWAEMTEAERAANPHLSRLVKTGSNNMVSNLEQGGWYADETQKSKNWWPAAGLLGGAALLTPLGWTVVALAILALII